MYSSLIAGLLGIYLGAVQLGAHWSMKLFWLGLIIWGFIKLVEGAPRVQAVVRTRRQEVPAESQA